MAFRFLLLATSLLPLSAQDTTHPGEEVLRANCISCHNQQNRTSGLALDNRADLLSGGNRGPAVKPGAAGESLLVRAVEQAGDLKMPPGKRLPAEQAAALRAWVDAGVPWPEHRQAARKRGHDHWAFQPPKRPPLPAVNNGGWPRNPIDRFILATLERERVEPSPEADRYTLLRRVSLDLTGLPPAPKEIRDFLADTSPDAYEKIVDRLLASPHHGERWARHWLDLARYADSDGYTIDDARQIWKYRDWVIGALNRDMPFDQFVIEQIAGDMLPNPTVDQLIATGFHRNTTSNYEGGIDFEQYRTEAVADRVATTGAAFLGLTLGCARCHDHKYDPVSQREYYQIFAYFNNTDEITREADRSEFNRPFLELPTPQEKAALAKYDEEVAAANRALVLHVRALAAKPAVAGEEPKHRDKQLAELLNKLRGVRRRKPLTTYTLIMRELPQPRQAYIHLGGDFTRKGAAVTPATPAALGPKLEGGTRLDFARWLVDAGNPLTARVTVNRMWQAYFGRGLVETENDFGAIGAKPSHPELLDWMATEFMARGWSQKAVHRLIVTSAAYRQSSLRRPELEERDPYNQLIARQARFRVEAEVARDIGLVASGLLNPTVGGRSVYPPVASGGTVGTQVPKPWPTSFGPDRYRRGLYTFTYRSLLYPALGFFDAPDGTATCTRRVRSNSPLQALTLLNDTAFVEFARSLAEKIVNEGGATDKARIEHGFLLTTGRQPSAAESDRLAQFLSLQRDEFQTDLESARLLLGGGGAVRALREAEEAAAAKPGGNQSPRGRAASEHALEEAKQELEAGKAFIGKRAAAVTAMSPAEVRELAAWTAVSRVLFNLDDFITRN
jgi:hypothetical protein